MKIIILKYRCYFNKLKNGTSAEREEAWMVHLHLQLPWFFCKLQEFPDSNAGRPPAVLAGDKGHEKPPRTAWCLSGEGIAGCIIITSSCLLMWIWQPTYAFFLIIWNMEVIVMQVHSSYLAMQISHESSCEKEEAPDWEARRPAVVPRARRSSVFASQ